MPRKIHATSLVATAICAISAARAQTAIAPAPMPDTQVNTDGIAGYFDTWFDRVNQAQASQPTWMTPLVTVTPRLEEEFRYDQYWETLPNGGSLQNYGTGKASN